MKGTARFSADRRYRYVLTRSWGGGRRITWVMLNPSTASAGINDATIRKVIGFTRQWGYPGFTVVNLFGYRSPDRRVLKKVADPVGPNNDQWVRWAVDQAPLVVAAWGGGGGNFPERIRQVWDQI